MAHRPRQPVVLTSYARPLQGSLHMYLHEVQSIRASRMFQDNVEETTDQEEGKSGGGSRGLEGGGGMHVARLTCALTLPQPLDTPQHEPG